MRTLRIGSLLVTELGMILVVGWTITVALILPKGMIHFRELIITTYTNGTIDFSTDATILFRTLGVISLLTLTLGLIIGAAIVLTTSSLHVKKKTDDYEKALAAADFMKITNTANGTTYQLTEHGRRFLKDYAFLNHESDTQSSQKVPVTNKAA